jgi:hypothetical protein
MTDVQLMQSDTIDAGSVPQFGSAHVQLVRARTKKVRTVKVSALRFPQKKTERPYCERPTNRKKDRRSATPLRPAYSGYIYSLILVRRRPELHRFQPVLPTSSCFAARRAPVEYLPVVYQVPGAAANGHGRRPPDQRLRRGFTPSAQANPGARTWVPARPAVRALF